MLTRIFSNGIATAQALTMDQFDPDDTEAVRELVAALRINAITPQISKIREEHPDLIRLLGPQHPVKAAAAFAGLLTQPNLQSNCLRLEALVHLCVAECHGRKTPPASTVGQAFRLIGNGRCGLGEDPAEDVFVSNVMSERGNFRVLDGIWESGGFFLQRIVNMIARMPDEPPFQQFTACVYALLRLTDAVCGRAGLQRNQRGNAQPESTVPAKLLGQMPTIRRLVRFSVIELQELGIDPVHLSPFIFDPDQRHDLRGETIAHTSLERRPLAWDDDELVVLLPTAISATVRRVFVERFGSGPNESVCASELARDYGELFARTPLLGDQAGAPVRFMPSEHGWFASLSWEVDRGRHLQLLFFVDPLHGFEDEGLAGAFSAFGALADPIDEAIEPAYQRARGLPDFRDGLTLLVGCGIGRNVSLWLNNTQRDGWRLETISAPDFWTLSWAPNMKPLHLWRIFGAQDALAERGLGLHNVNGLLNLVAWSRQLAGHLVPHADVPVDWDGAGQLMIEQNSLLELRAEVASTWDVHAEKDQQGKWWPVRRAELPLLPRGSLEPVYAIDRGGRPRFAICPTRKRTWWTELVLPADVDGELGHQRWKMITTWLGRAAPVIDACVSNLPDGVILWRCCFEADAASIDPAAAPLDLAEARDTVQLACDVPARVIELRFKSQFSQALFHAENIAEQALIDALLAGAIQLADQPPSSKMLEAIKREIVPDVHARQSHAFVAQTFRDHIGALHDAHPTTISKYDDAYIKIGLGWRVRTREEGGEVVGKDACIDFLNRLVSNLEDELCQSLKRFNRRHLVEALLSNYEQAAAQRDWWRRTASAQLALHSDKAAVLEVMARNEYKLNGVSQSTRIVIEAAVCESPSIGGFPPGDLDLTRLMALASTLFAVGGWSDSIRWDVMTPRLIIRPLGDVHVHADFFDLVVDPFAKAASDQRFQDAASSYGSNLEEPAGILTEEIEGLQEFSTAWEAEFGVPLDTMRRYLDELEDRGIEAQQSVFPMRKSELAALMGGAAAAHTIAELLLLEHRGAWRTVPDGYRPVDRHPWRFRRRLSALRRPLMQVDEDADPMILVCPGLIREAFGYTVSNYYRGDYPDWQLGAAMLAWRGRSRAKLGLEFNAQVAATLKNLGWLVECEIKPTKLLRQGLDRNYGDIDVLAWDPARGRILIIECKDVQYKKTPGEIAEQLSDFRGEMMSNGKPDLLKKHLDRVTVVEQRADDACGFIGMPKGSRIESHLVFKNPVPMQFVQSLAGQVRISLFADLAGL
ncbi:MAG: hypothetical protein PHH58_04090 [Rhodoferax sp.]|nr:hypothetical protein [Rhodoferax sp.]